MKSCTSNTPKTCISTWYFSKQLLVSMSQCGNQNYLENIPLSFCINNGRYENPQVSTIMHKPESGFYSLASLNWHCYRPATKIWLSEQDYFLTIYTIRLCQVYVCVLVIYSYEQLWSSLFLLIQSICYTHVLQSREVCKYTFHSLNYLFFYLSNTDIRLR